MRSEPLTDAERATAAETILAMEKSGALAEACGSWKTYLELPWRVQRLREELHPKLTAELKRRYFAVGSFVPAGRR